MIADFVEIGNSSNNMGANVTFAIEFLEAPPNMYVLSLFGRRSYGFGHCVAIDPLFDLDGSGAVVNFVGCVRGLGGYLEDLTNYGKLGL